MHDTTYVITYDVGTTGNKTCIYRIGKTIEIIDSYLGEYPLFITKDGGAEQKADDWWNAICDGTHKVLNSTGIAPQDIQGISFCCQMQGTVMVDKTGKALRNPMGYMDSRAIRQKEKAFHKGILRIEGINALKLLKWLRITGGCPATAKDPVWKYLWIKEMEPDVFHATDKWLDVKDYLLLRSTGNACMTQDSAHVTFLYDTRPGHLGWNTELCDSLGVDMDHLPPVIHSTDRVGGLTAQAASELGLAEGTPVFGGGGDSTLTAIGAGCLKLNEMHIYIGTSGWVSAFVDKRMVDVNNFIASIIGAVPGYYNYIAEQETSGACLKWVRDHLALDEIGVYLDAQHICEHSSEYKSLFDYMGMVVNQVEPGSGGVIFTPWFQGNRSPREDPYARAMFFNLGLSTGKRKLIRAVLEGVAYHKRWLIEAVERKVPHQDYIRFVGGGAKSEIWCQIMADVTGRTIEIIEEPQNAGTLGAAIITAIGLKKLSSFEAAKPMIPVREKYSPRGIYRDVYDRQFEVFKRLYANNKKDFHVLNKKT
jgi:xylulokinase